MNRKENFISSLLIAIIITLIGIIGVVGYTIYNEIMGEGEIKLNFGGEAGFPVIEYITTSKNSNNTSTNDNIIFNGVNGNGAITTTEQNQYGHLYNQLDSSAKIIYDKLYENKENLKTGTYTIEFGNTFSDLLSKNGGDDELQRQYQSAIEALIYEKPDIFYIDATCMYINIEKITKITGVKYNVYINNGTKTSYLAEGFYSKEDVDKAQAEIENVKNEILLMTYGKSDYEKIKIVHDYLVDNVEYDTTVLQNNIYDIYGALVLKRCVCEGYAKAFQYLMNEIGIENVIVIGEGTNSNNETENHAWNYVDLDENWYAIDVTWDDPILIGGGKLSQQSKYQYFLNGSITFNKNHTASGKFTDDGQTFEYPILSVNDYK